MWGNIIQNAHLHTCIHIHILHILTRIHTHTYTHAQVISTVPKSLDRVRILSTSSVSQMKGRGFLPVSMVHIHLLMSSERDRRGGGDSSKRAMLEVITSVYIMYVNVITSLITRYSEYNTIYMCIYIYKIKINLHYLRNKI